jgi:hypothetical protein
MKAATCDNPIARVAPGATNLTDRPMDLSKINKANAPPTARSAAKAKGGEKAKACLESTQVYPHVIVRAKSANAGNQRLRGNDVGLRLLCAFVNSVNLYFHLIVLA